jgi:hypothetical protein
MYLYTVDSSRTTEFELKDLIVKSVSIATPLNITIGISNVVSSPIVNTEHLSL